MKYLLLVCDSLRHKPMRFTLTLLSIAAAFLLLSAMRTVGYGLAHPSPAVGSDILLVFNKASLGIPLPYAYLHKIESIPGVGWVSPEDTIGASYRDAKTRVYAEVVEPKAFFAMMCPHICIPAEEMKTLSDTRNGAIVGPRIAARFGWRPGDLVTLNTNGNYAQANGSVDWTFNIVAVATTASADDLQQYGNRVLVQYAYIDEARTLNKGMSGMYTVAPQAGANADEVARAIDVSFANSAQETRTMPMREFFIILLKQLGNIGFIINSITAAVLASLAFTTANAMLHTFHERIPEFAVLKTIGFSDRLVSLLIIGEAVLTCALGAAAGIAGAYLLIPMLQKHIQGVDLSPLALAPGAVFALLLAVVIGAIPAWRAQRLQIVDALSPLR
jgi:putative ABC transport system permease protein